MDKDGNLINADAIHQMKHSVHDQMAEEQDGTSGGNLAEERYDTILYE